MTDTSKTCPICSTIFHRNAKAGISNERWRQQTTCSRACSAIHRRQREGGDHDVTQSRNRAKVSMSRRWEMQRAIAKAKSTPVSIRPSREDEEAAIARFVAERGVTRGDAVEQQMVQGRHEAARPQPMAGWR